MRYWLMKTEPDTFSIEDLERGGTEPWEGVRNYQARNYMRDQMQPGDRVLIHHSSTQVPAVAGTATVARAAYPDDSAWDPDSPYFDPKSSPDNPRWVRVDVRFESRFPVPLSMAELRTLPALADMLLLRKGQRLSVQPVTEREFQTVLRHAEQRAGDA
jgi:predicted RNA-binding protein with PUA-like domain